MVTYFSMSVIGQIVGCTISGMIIRSIIGSAVSMCTSLGSGGVFGSVMFSMGGMMAWGVYSMVSVSMSVESMSVESVESMSVESVESMMSMVYMSWVSLVAVSIMGCGSIGSFGRCRSISSVGSSVG